MIGQLGQSLPDDAKIRPEELLRVLQFPGQRIGAGDVPDGGRSPVVRNVACADRQRRFRDPQVRHCHSRHARGFARVAWRSGSPFIEDTDIGRLRFIESSIFRTAQGTRKEFTIPR